MYDRSTVDDIAVLEQMIAGELEKAVMDRLGTRQKYYFTPAAWQKEMENFKESKDAVGPCPGDMEKMLSGKPDTAPYLEQGSVWGWINSQPENKGKGILYGIGTVALLGMFLPSFRQKIQTVLSRLALEGAELLGDARALAARAKEDVEDLIAEANLSGLMKKPRS
ncbi:MAG: hypothetical protein GX334_04755 [Firmicutes bacterium]|nr:hypothetical protein [Bacillota bacterium]